MDRGAAPLAVTVEGVDANGMRTGADFRFVQAVYTVVVLQQVLINAVLSNTFTTGGGPFDATGVIVRIYWNPALLTLIQLASARGTVAVATCEPTASECEASVDIGNLAANEEIEMEVTFDAVAMGSTEIVFTEEQNEFNPGDQMGTVSVEITEAPTISGQKWLDLDGDGERDEGEGPLDGLAVELRDANGQAVASATTRGLDRDGSGDIDPLTERGLYEFPLPTEAGAYTVAEVAPEGWAVVSPAGGIHEINVADDAISDLDFFNDPPDDVEVDYGDLPDSFLTTEAVAGPSHFIFVDQILLGATLDADGDGVPTLDASGDDLFLPPQNQIDDEDGLVAFAFNPGGDHTLTVQTNAAGVLDAWLDYGDDGTFAGGEHIVVAGAIPGAGQHTFTFTIPSDEARGTYLRLRFHDVPGGVGVGGFVLNGEVEDYLVLGLDLGDANQDPLVIIPGMPFGYPVRISIDGARHLTNDLVKLGERVDAETDLNTALAAEAGLASNTATGDDNDPDDNQNDGPRDDEDGVAFGDGFVPFTIQLPVGTAEPSAPNALTRYGLVAGETGTLTFFPNVDGGLDAWFDWNRDGDWDDDGEQVFANERMGPSNPPPTRTVTAPANAPPGYFHARFRFSRNGALRPVGLAPDGEVEDYLMAVFPPLDFGDAPAPYPSSLASSGARHGVGDVWLGAEVDAEADALDDDGADDDGVVLPSEVYRGSDATMSVTVGGSTSASLYAWIDWNGDGDWDDDGEKVADGTALTVGTHDVTVPVPETAIPGTTWARFRISSIPLPFVSGAQPNVLLVPFPTVGEVEDYPVEVSAAAVAEDEAPVPLQTGLEAVYPNPATDQLVVEYALASSADITVRLLDVLGRVVLTIGTEPRGNGRHSARLDVSRVPSGTYIVVVQADAVRMTRRVVVVR